MMKLIGSLALVLAVAGALSLTAFAEPKEKDEAKKPKVGKAAPTFELRNADDETVKLSDFKGEIVVLHFQSCTCPWEIAYQPWLNEVATKYAYHGDKKDEDGNRIRRVRFIGINSNYTEDYEQIAAYAEKYQINYTVLKDPENKVADLYAAQTTPHMFIIDEKGVLRYKGGIEKAPLSPDKVTKSEEQYLVPALNALLKGEEVKVTESVSKGCTLKRVDKPREG